MCGIVAMVALERAVSREALERGMTALAHRGPDGGGSFMRHPGRVALGHTRLAVVDLENGEQPLYNEDGRVWAVVNGEFYGEQELRRELEGRGHRFGTRSDSELLVHLYEEHGVACLERLRGEFAFALWDERTSTLFAARDRFGVRPLCYATSGGVLHLASEAKALFAAGVPARWDRESFFQAAHAQYTLPDRTLFEGVFQLPPGHLLLARDGAVRIERYWDLDLLAPRASRDTRDPAEAIAALRAALDDAVRVRLRADVPVCFQLSGGLDSSAVLGLAARHATSPLACFTVSFGDPAYDERALAEETAARAGAVLHAVSVTPRALVDALPDAVAQGEGLAINGHLAAKFLLSRAVRDAGFRVVLTGEGSDEVLLGYPHFRQDLARAGGAGGVAWSALRATNQASAGIMLAEGEALGTEAVARALGFVPAYLEAKATLGRRVRGFLAAEFLAGFEGRDAYGALLEATDVAGQLRGRHPVDQSAYLWARSALAGYILRTLGDGMEMAHAVEGRLPFLDAAVFECARALPMDLLIRDGVEKYALREAVAPELTPAVRARQKHPFMAPPLSAEPRFAELLQDQLRARDAVPFFDRARLRALLDRAPAMDPRERTATDPALMLALTASILHHRYGL